MTYKETNTKEYITFKVQFLGLGKAHRQELLDDLIREHKFLSEDENEQRKIEKLKMEE